MANAAPFVAKPMRRVAAGAINFVVAMITTVVVVALCRSTGAQVDELWLALMLYGTYHAGFFWLWDGQTPGLATLDICIVGAGGNAALAPMQAVGRGVLRPVILYGVGIAAFAASRDIQTVAMTVTAVLLVDLGLMFTLPSRQTLSDLAARTLAVNVPPPQPHRAPAAPMYSETDAEFGVRPQQIR